MTDYGAFVTDPLFGLPLQELWSGLVFFILGMFLFLDGSDFGVGVIFTTCDDDEEREMLLAAIGPFWDGNRVWLAIFGDTLSAAFPAMYANFFSHHCLLMFAVLGALILRGLAPEMHEQRHNEAWQTWWDRAFVVSSVSAPFFLGVFITHWLLGVELLLSLPGVIVGLAAVALTVVAGVSSPVMEIHGDLQRDVADYGPRAMATCLALVVVTFGYLVIVRLDLGVLTPTLLAPVVISLAAAAGYLLALREGRYMLAFGTVPMLVFAFVTLVTTFMFLLADPATGLTVADTIISMLPLSIMSVTSALLLPLVFIYFGILYSAFGGPIETEESYS